MRCSARVSLIGRRTCLEPRRSALRHTATRRTRKEIVRQYSANMPIYLFTIGGGSSASTPRVAKA
jgi:hypothetical protein